VVAVHSCELSVFVYVLRLNACVGKSAVNKAAFYVSVHNSWAFLLQKRFSFIIILVAIATNNQSDLLSSSIRQ